MDIYREEWSKLETSELYDKGANAA